jgi:outer membrane protein OmpA-like peptidoglycan-associated protein
MLVLLVEAVMQTKLLMLLAAIGVASPAYAGGDSAATGPDFLDNAPARHIGKDVSTSDGGAKMHPMAQLMFDFDKSVVNAADRPELEAARTWIQAHPSSYLVIEGFTDTVGTYAYNAGLAARRAEAVRAALIDLGAPADRLVVGIYGEVLATGHHTADRRVIVRGTNDSLAKITSRTLVQGMGVVWDYQPTNDAVARRNSENLREFFRG